MCLPAPACHPIRSALKQTDDDTFAVHPADQMKKKKKKQTGCQFSSDLPIENSGPPTWTSGVRPKRIRPAWKGPKSDWRWYLKNSISGRFIIIPYWHLIATKIGLYDCWGIKFKKSLVWKIRWNTEGLLWSREICMASLEWFRKKKKKCSNLFEG